MSESPPDPQTGPIFRVERTEPAGQPVQLQFSGILSLADGNAIWDAARAALQPPAERYCFDLREVDHLDSGSMALLSGLKEELVLEGSLVEIRPPGGSTGQLVALVDQPCSDPLREAAGGVGLLDQVGRTVIQLKDGVKETLDFAGQLFLAVVGAIRRPSSTNWRAVWPTMERVGADGVPIVVLINFLIGIILAFQAALQLKKYGANLYVADMVSISLVRELGPLMTAIIAAGRTGAAYAAELGTMKVSEEIDALRTMGICPYRYLVLPKTIALVLVLPLLTLLGEVVGIFGGMIVAVGSLDLTPVGYFNRVQVALSSWSVLSGLIKCCAYACVVGLVGCQRGLATRGGASGVGRSTTSAVVTILFLLIVVNAFFTGLFTAFDL